jgi:hypothetical protein
MDSRKGKVMMGADGEGAAKLDRRDEARPLTRRKPVNARDAEWQKVASQLAEMLGCLEAGHFLCLQTRGDAPYFVQCAAGGSDGFLLEATSNRVLPDWRRLDATAQGRLRRLGWRPPTDIGDGPVNWWRLYPADTPARQMAELAVATLRKAFDVPRPRMLVYRAFSRGGDEILLPTLGVAHYQRRAPLDERVDAALRDYLQIDEVIRDEDGDRPVRRGEAMVYVRVVADPGFVAVFAPALLNVTPSAALVEAVNELNNKIRLARASVAGDAVMIAAEVDDQPALESGVINAFKAVSAIANGCGPDLQARFGGNTFFAQPAVSGEPRAEPACGFYL